MKSIQTLFIDIDNTLYDHINQVIPKKHIIALKELKKKGYKLCICTGRPPILVEELHLDTFIDWDGYVCGNGCYVLNRNHESLYENVIDTESTNQIFHYANEKDLGVLAFGNVKMATRKDSRVKEMIETFHFKDVEIRNKKDTDRFSNILIKPDHPLERNPFFDSLESIDPVYMSQWVEFKRKGANKFKGIQILMNSFHEDEHAYLAFGDSAIDYEMLANAQIAVMVANGDDRLKSIPHIQIAPSCHEGGLYDWLKENEMI